MRQSSRAARHLEAARAAGLPQRFEGVMLWRDDETPTFHLASVVDDADFEITHVIRGSDHRPNEELHAALHRALGTKPPQVIHHGLVVGDDGKKLSKRAEGATVAALREAGYPAEAVRAYLEELGLPRHDVHLDLDRIRSLSVDVLGRMSDEELAERLGVPVEAVAARPRRARSRRGGGADSAACSTAPSANLAQSPETLARFVELRAAMPELLDKDEAKSLQRELKAVGGDLRGAAARADRRARAGPSSGPCCARCRGTRRCGAHYARSVRLYDTLTRSPVELPPPPGPIRMYFCGPTVYARAHVGNARPFVVGDVAALVAARDAATRRRSSHNITDINDKIYDAAPGASAELADARHRVVPGGHRRPRARHAGLPAEGDRVGAADRRPSSRS